MNYRSRLEIHPDSEFILATIWKRLIAFLQSLGKYFLRLKGLSLYHEHLGFWHCIERSLGYFASALEFGIGFIQAFGNPNRMTLHDKIGETIVIELPVKK
jgi:hypothetical protein